MTISFVVPVYNNRSTLARLCSAIEEVARSSWPREPLEIILVDDGSPDAAWQEIARLSAVNRQVKGVRLSVNHGQHIAVLTGISKATGDWLVSLDGDLQDDPAIAPQLLAILGDDPDIDLVFAGRRGRYQGLSSMLTSFLYRQSVLRIVGLPRDAGMYFAMRGSAKSRLLNAANGSPSVIGLIAARLNSRSIPVRRARRPAGRSSYNFARRMTLAMRVLGTFAAARAGRSSRPGSDGESIFAGLVREETPPW